MAQRGYLGIHAEVPTAQYLRSAIVVNGAQEQNQKRSSLVAGLFWAVLHPYNVVGLGRGAKLARDGGGSATHMLSVPSLCSAFDFDLNAPLTTLAERRHCVVGIPAWMPG
ncbi:hypothetical protein [Pseudomonas brassicacearum]|uniref:hypothetical protein n=1 Tax=Pseudomonas brassicacearum TaxID=930166 RepID=UPI0009BC5512|nr:hypothetical protein [Pseudomonas brassicacearum]